MAPCGSVIDFDASLSTENERITYLSDASTLNVRSGCQLHM
jgi:hypothetical protein